MWGTSSRDKLQNEYQLFKHFEILLHKKFHSTLSFKMLIFWTRAL
jgi:hypothetical protein